MPRISGIRTLALHQFDADAIRRRDIAQQAAAHAFLQFDRKTHAFRAQLIAERLEIALVQKAEMVGAPRIMAGKIRVLPDRPGSDRGFARPLSADQDRHAAEFDKDLRGAAGDRVGDDRGTEHLDVPICRRMRIPADDVDVIEFECRIAHSSFSSLPSWSVVAPGYSSPRVARSARNAAGVVK